MDKGWWEHEVADVQAAFGGAAWHEERCGKDSTRFWKLRIAPVPDDEDLHLVLADLEEGRGINMGPQGRIRHSQKCCHVPVADHPEMLPRLKLSDVSYEVGLTYPIKPFGPRGPIHPRVRILNPEISAQTIPKHPHMYMDSNTKDSWVCPMSPHATEWTWKRGATVEYLDQVSLWLLKTLVWTATGGVVMPSIGRWIGPDASHNALDLMRSSTSQEPCRCGNGNIYESCHFQSDLLAAIWQVMSDPTPGRLGQSSSRIL